MFAWLFKKTKCQELGHFWEAIAGDGTWTEYNDHMPGRVCLRCGLVDTVTTSEHS